jgi:protein CpxP
MGHGMAGAGMMSERMLDAVDASAEQKTKVRDLLKAAQDDMRKQREGDQALHHKMMAVLAAPQVDAAAAEALRQQLQARRDVASRRQLQAMLDVGAVLTPEQRQMLADRMKSRHDSLQQRHHERQASEPRS